ncbi:hypothetical protein KBC75_04430 [Candidatus Shapirobacteria bacterium]|nr:hypothetical protein [Candidatus Shapirobacteria bacterium]
MSNQNILQLFITKSLVGLSVILVALSVALIAQKKLLTIKKVVDVISAGYTKSQDCPN